MESLIPSSAFLKIGKQLVVKTPTTPVPAPPPIPTPIRELALVIREDVTTYDILKGWAHEFIEYCGEYASPFM
jgi:hypothetical protein